MSTNGNKKAAFIMAVNADADNCPYINAEGSQIDVCTLLATAVKKITSDYNIPLKAFCDILQTCAAPKKA